MRIKITISNILSHHLSILHPKIPEYKEIKGFYQTLAGLKSSQLLLQWCTDPPPRRSNARTRSFTSSPKPQFCHRLEDDNQPQFSLLCSSISQNFSALFLSDFLALKNFYSLFKPVELPTSSFFLFELRTWNSFLSPSRNNSHSRWEWDGLLGPSLDGPGTQ